MPKRPNTRTLSREEEVHKFVNGLVRDIKKVEKSLKNEKFFKRVAQSKFDNACVMGATARLGLMVKGFLKAASAEIERHNHEDS